MPDRLVIIRPAAKRLVVTRPGTQGPRGEGWSPVLSVASDGERRVLQVIGWLGGTGTAPATGQYLGEAGYVSDIEDATDVRGSVGEAGSVVSWVDVLDKPSTFAPSPHTHTKSEVGLPNVDNTSDLNKPVSTLQAAADTAVANAAAADATTKANAAQAAAETTATNALSAHVGAPDPHPIYTSSTELASALAGKSDVGHTHTLSNLTQSGATTGQIAQWNGTQWVPVTFTAGIGGSTGGTNNAVLVANGTGGATLQARTGVNIDGSSNLSVLGNITGSGRLTAGFSNAGGGASNQLGAELNGVASWALCIGRGAQTDHLGGISGGGHYFAGYGDNMWVIGNACRAVSNDTPAELFENATSTRWATPFHASGTFLAVFTARTSSAGGKSLHALRLVFWRKGATNASLSVSAQILGTDTQADGSAWPAGTALAIDADTTNGTIRYRFTGEPATNYRATLAQYGNQVIFA